jgi:hypothetical protein
MAAIIPTAANELPFLAVFALLSIFSPNMKVTEDSKYIMCCISQCIISSS